MKYHIKNKHEGLFCDICFFQPLNLIKLWDHAKVSHNNVVFTCTQCNDKFPSKLNQKYHFMKTHKKAHMKKVVKRSPLRVEPFPYSASSCDMCDFMPSISTIRIHKNAVHLGVRYACPQCILSCSTRSNMLQHVAEKHKGKRVYCKLCTFTGKNTNHLSIHNKKVHLGIRYNCEMENCEFSSSYRSVFRHHIKLNHNINEDTQYYCLVCYETFVTMTFFKMHIRKNHEGLF